MPLLLLFIYVQYKKMNRPVYGGRDDMEGEKEQKRLFRKFLVANCVYREIEKNRQTFDPQNKYNVIDKNTIIQLLIYNRTRELFLIP